MTLFSKNRMLIYSVAAKKLLDHLDQMIDPSSGFPDEPNWGYAFSLLAGRTAEKKIFSDLCDLSAKHLRLQNKSDKDYAWEFVFYALLQPECQTDSRSFLLKYGYREKGTRMFNWYLLRHLNRRLFGRAGIWNYITLRLALWLYQDSSGMFLDEFKTRSLQYHSFCLFILAEIIEIHPDYAWLKRRFLDGISFSLDYILTDGSALFIGRGQDQIFGYGSLLYALEYCNKKVKVLPDEVLNRLANHVLSFQRPDGSFPLVLRRREPEAANISFRGGRTPGWYGYNNLYDYQPFLAYCLLKAKNLNEGP